MIRIWCVTLLALCLLAIGCFGQQAASVQASKDTVRQGKSINFQIKLDRPVNVPAAVFVFARDAEGHELSYGTGLSPESGTSVEVGGLVGLNTPAGKFKIELFVEPRGLERTRLSATGDLSFEVTKHGEIVLPSRAEVEITH